MALLPGYRPELTIFNIGISGAMAGYFLGWLGRFILSYRHESEAALAKKDRPLDQVSTAISH
jgi:hypothetical protein